MYVHMVLGFTGRIFIGNNNHHHPSDMSQKTPANYLDESSSESCAGEHDSDESSCESFGWVLEDYPDENSNAQPQIPADSSSQVDQLAQSFRSMKMKPKIDEKKSYYVLVDGYYRKHLSMGGYGVVVIDRHGSPVVALSGLSKFGAVSEYLHTLEGIEAAIRLARKYGIKKFYVACNSGRVAADVATCVESFKEGCFNKRDGVAPHQDFDTYCITCCVRNCTGEDRLHVVQVLKEIVMLGAAPCYNRFREVISYIYKRQNRAADFLAKCEEQKEYQRHEIPPQVFQYMIEDLRADGVPEHIKTYRT